MGTAVAVSGRGTTCVRARRRPRGIGVTGQFSAVDDLLTGEEASG